MCDYQLTIPPILTAYTIDNRKLYKCGRCEHINRGSQKWTRNDFFEAVAKHVSHPCSYAQCNKQLNWNRVKQHEINCPHKSIRCPLEGADNCTEMVRLNQLRQHFVDTHEDIKIIEDNCLSLDYTNKNTLYLLKMQDDYFFIYMLQENKIVCWLRVPISTPRSIWNLSAN